MIETAHIIAVGDEVLWGETVNTNAAWMANFLMSFGVRPICHVVVPDHEPAIGEAVQRALAGADLAVVIGGLGPTADDRTLDAVSSALERPLAVDAEILAHISRRHGHTSGWQESVRRQARILSGAVVWKNPRGQAPGQLAAVDDRYVLLLPGPPREMQGIAEKWVGPWISDRTTAQIHRDTLSVFDMGESQVASHLWPLLEGHHPRTGIYAQPGRVDVRLETPDTVAGQIVRERARSWVLSRLPVPVFELQGIDRETMLVKWLTGQQITIAAMESLTGGLLLSHLIAVPGASQTVAGGIVAYTDQAKQAHGVSEQVLAHDGAVSEACAVAMAQAGRQQFGADVGVATTGYAGPDGGSDANPVGTFFVAAVTDTKQVVRRRYAPLERQAVRQIAVHTAISAVWELLKLPTLVKNLDTY